MGLDVVKAVPSANASGNGPGGPRRVLSLMLFFLSSGVCQVRFSVSTFRSSVSILFLPWGLLEYYSLVYGVCIERARVGGDMKAKPILDKLTSGLIGSRVWLVG